eukprot:TRINITY_DN35353_c0_g1_i2.p1 TRINITY_DN35353_c0_g1~~TRINITY_DN35353_c0_g1_i2.p1  ORF type:complete len:964 (+),score=145.59 TRINITY_DN35353_c0_g1_i2:75-2894(+)
MRVAPAAVAGSAPAHAAAGRRRGRRCGVTCVLAACAAFLLNRSLSPSKGQAATPSVSDGAARRALPAPPLRWRTPVPRPSGGGAAVEGESFLTWISQPPANLLKQAPDPAAQAALGAWHLAQLAGAALVAALLNRTLLLPQALCITCNARGACAAPAPCKWGALTAAAADRRLHTADGAVRLGDASWLLTAGREVFGSRARVVVIEDAHHSTNCGFDCQGDASRGHRDGRPLQREDFPLPREEPSQAGFHGVYLRPAAYLPRGGKEADLHARLQQYRSVRVLELRGLPPALVLCADPAVELLRGAIDAALSRRPPRAADAAAAGLPYKLPPPPTCSASPPAGGADDTPAPAEGAVAAPRLVQRRPTDLAELLNFASLLGPREEGGFLAVTFAGANLEYAVRNWWSCATDAGVRTLIGALDSDTLAALKSLGASAFLVSHALSSGESGHSSAKWKGFAQTRSSIVRILLHRGFTVAMVDVDAVFLRSPADYIACSGGAAEKADPPRLSCGSVRGADVLVSSDNLGPSEDARSGAGYLRFGICNTGFLVFRPTQAARDFADRWVSNLVRPESGYAKLTSDQQVFNVMMRNGSGRWPGMDEIAAGPGSPFPSRLLSAWGGRVRLGVLPIALFANGHSYFVQKAHARMGAEPYIAHSTYTFGVSDLLLAKQVRFLQAGLWPLPKPLAPRVLSVDWDWADAEPVLPSHGQGGAWLVSHLAAVSAQMAALKVAIAAARALGRALVLPRLRCRCDKVWSGSESIVVSGCMYTGAHNQPFLPFDCPFDHLFDTSKLVDRATGRLFVRTGQGSEDMIELLPRPPSGDPVVLMLRADGLGQQRDSAALRRAAADLTAHPHVRLAGSGVRTALCTADPELDAAVAQAMPPSSPWCTLCRRGGTVRSGKCGEVIPSSIFSQGRLLSVPHGEQWCVDLPQLPSLGSACKAAS